MTERPNGYSLPTDLDSRLRVATFSFLADQVEARGDEHDILKPHPDFLGERYELFRKAS